MNLVQFLRETSIEDLSIPTSLKKQLVKKNYTTLHSLYTFLQSYRTFHVFSEDFSEEEISLLNEALTELLVKHGLRKSPASPNKAKLHTSSSASKPAPVKRTSPAPCQTTSPEKSPKPLVERKAPQKKTSRRVSEPLQEWEQRLAGPLGQVQLVGEIPLSKVEVDSLALQFSILFHRYSLQDVTHLIEEYYPAAFVVFLVSLGVYGYEGGDYWKSVGTALKKNVPGPVLGQTFENILKRFGKPLFKELQEKGYRYVSLILAHGGVPVYCLTDFFNNIVVNSAIRPQLMGLDGEELIEEIIKHSGYLANTDKPVLNFLEFGGTTAANLLDRSRQLLLTWQQTKVILSPQEAGLPNHVVEHFREWSMVLVHLSNERASQKRLKRPEIRLDPWGYGIHLYLPPEPVRALSGSEYRWVVSYDDVEEELYPRRRPKVNHYETQETNFELFSAPNKINVKFESDEEPVSWSLRCFDEKSPLLAFDPITGRLLSHLLNQETWLVYPSGTKVQAVEGEMRLTETLPSLPDAWEECYVEGWDLTECRSFCLIQSGQAVAEFTVLHRENLPLPTLVGKNPVPTDMDADSIPVYQGEPPELHIPLVGKEPASMQLAQWNLALKSIGEADPDITIRSNLNQLDPACISLQTEKIILRLNAKNLLGERSFGTYEARLTGPLGRDGQFLFRIVPECEVSGLPTLIVPRSITGSPAVTFSLRTRLLDRVEGFNSGECLKILPNPHGETQVEVPGEISAFTLHLVHETRDRSLVRVPLSFQLRRVRWRFIGQGGVMGDWTTRTNRMTVYELLQDQSPVLIVDIPSADPTNPVPTLSLVDTTDYEWRAIKPTEHTNKRAVRYWRFDLNLLKHSVECSEAPLLCVVLKIGDCPPIAILSLSREVFVENLSAEGYASSDHLRGCVTWNERTRLASRAIYLWSLFRPWQAPAVVYIPDDNNGEHEFVLPLEQHEPGNYRGTMVVVDPWTGATPPALPPERSKDTFDLVFVTEQDRLSDLNRRRLVRKADFSFGDLLETIIICRRIGKELNVWNDLLLCIQNLDSASAGEIMALVAILEENQHVDGLSRFIPQALQPKPLQTIYEGIQAGSIAPTMLRKWLTHPLEHPLPIESYRILAQVNEDWIRQRALKDLLGLNIKATVETILQLIESKSIMLEDVVELLYEAKRQSVAALRECSSSQPIAKTLVDLLLHYNPYTGLPLVKVGSWVKTDAGWGRIEGILDPSNNESIDSFIEDQGKYLLQVALHPHLTPWDGGERVTVDPVRYEIVFHRAKQVFACPYCNAFATSQFSMFKAHLVEEHENATPNPPHHGKILPLSKLEYGATIKDIAEE